MEGQTFMFSPLGALPIAADGSDALLAFARAEAELTGSPSPEPEPKQERFPFAPGAVGRNARPGAQVAPVVIQAPSAPLKPKDVVRAAKARAADIRRELKRLRALEKELAELERLIAAAKQKPVAIVRNIDHARGAR